jgi:3-oxoacyl-[acyl-carrier protein] reductase
MDLGLDGRAAIVTGASRGIGKRIAEDLVAEGCRVLLCARSAGPLDDLAVALGDAAVAFPVDLTDPPTAQAIVDRCGEAFGRVDILVNNAGESVPKPLPDLTDDDWREGFELTFFAAARLAGACAPVMRAAGWGRMVHVASVNGVEPDPIFAPYSAAKAALLNLSTTISRAYAADGVLSSCVVPGIVLTDLVTANARASAEHRGTTVEDVMARMMAKHPVDAGRFGEVEEVSRAVLFLASEAASWITGATLEVDGGTLRSV